MSAIGFCTDTGRDDGNADSAPFIYCQSIKQSARNGTPNDDCGNAGGGEESVYTIPLEKTQDSWSSQQRLSTTTPGSKATAAGRQSKRPEALLIAETASEISNLLDVIQRESGSTTRAARNMSKQLGHLLRQRSLIVDLLAILFGIGTWIGITGTFIQLPLLVEEAPEGWSLPSYLSVMVQLGNIGPLVYTLVQRYARGKNSDAYMIYSLLAMATVSALLTAFFYNETALLFGEPHSLALFVLTFVTAISACTSSVLFMPYMGRFQEKYLVTYFIGEGLSGLLPSVVALIQGVGGSAECVLQNVTAEGEEIYEKYTAPPLFGTTAFFIFIFAMMLCSCIGFLLLDRLKLARQQYAAVTVTSGNCYVYERDEKLTIPSDAAPAADESTNQSANADLTPLISVRKYWSLLVLIGTVSFFANGMFNSIQSYSTLPYGSNAYHLSATLSVIANPVACFLAIFLPHTSLRPILSLTGVAGLLTVYVFVTATMSPTPPLYDSDAGAVLVIATWTLLIGFISYIKLGITAVMRAQGGKSLMWTGALTQLGSLLGSILIFVLINYTNSFVASYEDDAC